MLSSPKLSRLKINSKNLYVMNKNLKFALLFNSNKYSTSITSSPTSSNF